MLADFQIKKRIGRDIKISPYDPLLVQPASLDLRLGNSFMGYTDLKHHLDPESIQERDLTRFECDEFVINPDEFLLATTLEWVGIDSTLAARVEGKSTIGRLGLTIHSTAGFIDPGFEGNITLEMKNSNTRPILLRKGMRIAQISFFRMDAPPQISYGDLKLGSHYQGQTGVTGPASLQTL